MKMYQHASVHQLHYLRPSKQLKKNFPCLLDVKMPMYKSVLCVQQLDLFPDYTDASNLQVLVSCNIQLEEEVGSASKNG